MPRSHFSYEKRRKELEKKKKKEARLAARAERKAAAQESDDRPEPIVKVDEDGNVVEIYPDDEDGDSDPGEDAGQQPSDPEDAS